MTPQQLGLLSELFGINRNASNLWLAERAAAILSEWRATHMHRKGTLYRVIARGKIEADLTPVVVYDDREGHVWVRPVRDFDDGRFTPVTVPPPIF